MQTKSLPAKAFAVLASFILAFSLLGQAAFPRTSEAVTWAEYLSGKWQECKDDFASWDKTTSLKPWDGTSVQPTQGSGTPTDPYKITTPEQLAWVMGSAPQASRSFVLMNDLDLGGLQRKNWLPSDQGSITNEVVMDGNGHTIYNMHIERSSGSYKQPGLGFISHVDNPNWTMKNITFKFAEVKRTGGSRNFSVGVGYFVRGTLDTVSVQDSIVEGADFTGALAVGWDTGYKATDDGATWKESTTGTYITNCNAQRVYTYGNSCSGNFTGPLMGCKVTDSFASGGVTIATGGHSGGFVSCPGYVHVENSYCNITMYGNERTAVFSGVSHYNNVFKNCYSSGVLEGTSVVGGFVGDATAAASNALFENCYSTTMVGMQSTANNMGGFAGVSNAFHTFRNCYSAGEVGALTTAGTNLKTVGGFVGNPATGSWSKFENCSFDAQTSAIASPSGTDYPIPAANGTVKALQTKQSTGTGALTTMNLPSSMWQAGSGVYPQLKYFANASGDAFGTQKARDLAIAGSQASVCTAMLYPSNGDYEDANADTVRSIRYLFPLTNDAMVNDDRFSVSWKADELYSDLVGNHDIPIITLNNKTYEVSSLAPGIGWCTVTVKYEGAAGDAYGSRRLRLVPTTTLSVATAAGVDHTAYVQASHDGIRPIPQKAVDDGLTTYDHRNGVNFSLGDAVQLAGGQIKTEPFPKDEESFVDVVLPATIGGIVDVTVDKQVNGEWVPQSLDSEALQSLLLKKRDAEKSDLGLYRLTYKWYTSGNKKGASLESVKYLSVIETFAVTYYKNDGKLEQPSGATIVTPQSADGSEQPYYFDPGAYVPGNTVDIDYYPGSASSSVDNPSTPGYTFVGWATDPEATEPDFDQTTKLTGDTEVYALWAKADHKVTFDANGGTYPEPVEEPDPDDPNPGPAPAPVPGTETEEVHDYKALDRVTPPAHNPLREGYSFMGWATDPEAKTPDFDPQAQVWDEDATFYAVWKKNPTPQIKSEVVNVTDPTSETLQAGDELKNIVTLTNAGDPDSLWKDVKVIDPLPEGVTLVPGTIVLRSPDGTEIPLKEEDVYDPETRTLKIPVGDIDGEKTYVVTFLTSVNGKALDEETKDITNTPAAEGSNPDGTPLQPIDEAVLPVGGDNTLPDDPEVSVEKTVTNTTRSDNEDALVGDVLAYEITVKNNQAFSQMKEAVITDPLPAGITLDERSLVLTMADGTQTPLDPAQVYDPEARTIMVNVGELAADQVVKLSFKATVNDLAADPATPESHDIGNKAFVNGITPEDKDSEEGTSSKTYPTGWIKFATPDPNVKKTVANESRDAGFYQGDSVTYTIRVANDMPGTSWKNVRITDVIPEGLELDTGSIRMIHADGTVETLMSYNYVPETRTLVATIDSVKGDEAWEIKYTCKLYKPEHDEPIVNNVKATGSTPDQVVDIEGFSKVSIDSPKPAPVEEEGTGPGNGNGPDDGSGNNTGVGDDAGQDGSAGNDDVENNGTAAGLGSHDADGAGDQAGANLAKTGDSSMITIIVLGIAVVIAIGALIYVKRRDK